jgi:pimeloyl-ACP methyl ester carboxylesterase
MNAKKHILKLSHGTVHYWVYNPAGPQTILMVHGFRGDHHGLEDIIAELPAHYRVIVPDLPGFGESSELQGTHNIENYTQFLHEFIQKVTHEPAILLGHSFGSILTAHFAAKHPKAITKLILVNPIASPALKGRKAIFSHLTVFYYWLGNKLPARAGHKLLSSKAIVLTMSALLAKTKDKALRRKIHRGHLAHFSSFQSRRVVMESFKASVSHTATEKADTITAPTLLIVGEVDDIAPLSSQKQLQQKLADSQLIVAPKVGHLIHHEAPDIAAHAIVAFCESTK